MRAVAKDELIDSMSDSQLYSIGASQWEVLCIDKHEDANSGRTYRVVWAGNWEPEYVTRASLNNNDLVDRHALAYTLTHTHTHNHIHAHTRATHTHTHTHTNACARIHICTHAHS